MLSNAWRAQQSGWVVHQAAPSFTEPRSPRNLLCTCLGLGAVDTAAEATSPQFTGTFSQVLIPDPTHKLGFFSWMFTDESFAKILAVKELKTDVENLYNYQQTNVWACVYVRAKSLQLCPTFCNPMDFSPPGCYVHGISQAKILEWVAISYSRRSSRLRDQTLVSYVSCIGRWVLYH